MSVDTPVLEEVRAHAPATVSVWLVPGAPHTGGLPTDPSGREQQVIGFLDSALGP